MQKEGYRKALTDYVREQAQPPDKFSHQARLYRLAVALAGDQPYDDDVLFAAAWIHDLGVFIGHRPKEARQLASWDHLAYVLAKAPEILAGLRFPAEKVPAVLEAVRTHMPSDDPTSFEGVLLRDADILEQLGSVGILRTVSKVGRDTRFKTFADALAALQKNLDELPGKLRLDAGREEAINRIALMRSFLANAEAEANGIDW